MNGMNNKTKAIALTGLVSAIIVVLSVWQIPMPFGVPLTLQTFAVSLAGYVLSAKKGVLATVVYILLGLVNLPVFSGFQGGAAVVFGPTGGFILGFVALAFFAGLGSGKRPFSAISLGAVGICVCHIAGICHCVFVMKTGFLSAFLSVSLPYLLKDVLFVAGAYFLSRPIKSKVKI